MFALKLKVFLGILFLAGGAIAQLGPDLWRIEPVRNLVGVQGHQFVLLHELLDHGIGENVPLVQLAIGAGNTREIDEHQLAFFLGFGQALGQIAAPGQVAFLLLGQEERIEPGENDAARPLAVALVGLE